MLDALAILVALTVLGIVAFGMRPLARGEAMLAELERALARTGRPVTDGTTLSALERRLGSDTAPAAYVRALRLQRFGGSGERPTLAQRRALRGPLRAGLGPLGGSGHCGRFRLAGWLSGAGRIIHGVLKLERDGRRLRPLPARDRAARGRPQPPGDDPALARARPRPGQDLDPRGARPRAVRRPALRAGGRPSSRP